jgi:[acyl-carrier-protein] S-malonyltransferase
LIGMAKRIDPRLQGEALVDQAALERILAQVNQANQANQA